MNTMEDMQLRGWASLTAITIATSHPTPIYHLPPEILSYIFTFSKNYCDHETTPHRDGFSEVSVYWRQTAVSTPALWNHIDISVNGYKPYHYESAQLYLARSGDLPVHMHIYQPKHGYNNSTTSSEIRQLIALLTPRLARIGTLDLESASTPARLVESIIQFWLDNGIIGSTTTLSVSTAEMTSLNQMSRSIYQAKSPGRFEDVLSHLRVLRLHNAMFRLDSAAYRGLLELQIKSSSFEQFLPISGLVAILSSCPKLHTLKLVNLTINGSDEDMLTPARLEALQVLNMTGVGGQSIDLLFPLIYVPKRTTKLDVGITFINRDEFDSPAPTPFMQLPITTLYLHSDRMWNGLPRLLQLLSCLPNLERLALHQFNFEGPLFPEDNSHSLAPTLLEGTQRRFPHEIYIINCTATLEALEYLIRISRARVVHLEDGGYFTDRGSHQGPKMMKDAAKLLSRTYPDLEVNVSETDTTTQWPCRSRF
ncbi:hypothetical protein BDV93DRAFT_528114 [Ceratobasidium sp. AG-I]|nr:hypothetical protein BDV93DRAFT_528114 [Ceratobasidium sp. AG-I]